MKLLHLDSSVLDAQSASRELTAAVVAAWQAVHPRGTVTYRDLAADPLPHLDGAALAKADPDAAAEAERVLEEFLAADVVVVGAPMYNFSIPSQLKAWIDRVAVAGRTFRYTAEGPRGLAGGKRVVVASTRGGMHSGAPSDFVEPYLRQVFGFLGIEEIELVTAEGLAYSPDHRAKAMAGALASIRWSTRWRRDSICSCGSGGSREVFQPNNQELRGLTGGAVVKRFAAPTVCGFAGRLRG